VAQRKTGWSAMNGTKVLKSTCALCFSGCGVLVHVKDNRVIAVKGDPESPVNRGVLCPKGRAAVEYQYHPGRLRLPLLRKGARGEGRWQEIPWDEAFDRAARGLAEIKEGYGAESVAFVQGTARGLANTYLARLSNAFGSPNVSTSGHVCFLPRYFASILTNGFYPIPDYQGAPDCILVWGANMAATRLGEHLETIKASRNGSRLIVVDPLKTRLARSADQWLRVRPGADLALALGMIHVIVQKGLHDREFVDAWCRGFDLLEEHVRGYTPDKVSAATWVPAEAIEQAAQTYAQASSAAIQWGNAIDHGPNSFQAARALCILRALTGNLGRSGGDIQTTFPLQEQGSSEITLQDRLPKAVWDRRVGADTPLLPLLRRVLPQDIVRAVLKETPYPIKGMFIHGANPLLTFGNATRALAALRKLDFIVASDRFLTPTTAMADIVLPAATHLEFDSIASPPYYPIIQVQQKAIHTEGSRSDFDIVNGIGKCLGMEPDFSHDMEDLFDRLLEPEGITFDRFRDKGYIAGPRHDKLFEEKGFNTPSGKVELYSPRLEGWGFDPLPDYHEPPETPFSDPEGAASYPLVLTSKKSAFYRHSDYRQVPSLRRGHTEPIARMHSQTARERGVQEGDWVLIETPRGRIWHRCAQDDDLDPRIVVADFGWWFPEKGTATLYGWAESNINILTDDQPPFSPEMGSNNFRGLFCEVKKA